jgi:hypothetical protein
VDVLWDFVVAVCVEYWQLQPDDGQYWNFLAANRLVIKFCVINTTQKLIFCALLLKNSLLNIYLPNSGSSLGNMIGMLESHHTFIYLHKAK